MEAIGKEFVRREFRFTPARGEVVSIYRETAKCPVCSMAPAMAGAAGFVKAHVPEALIPHSYASASAVAWTMYQKYANSMPLYRQEQDWKQMGVILSRATLANWILYCAGNYFSPLYGYFRRELIKRQFLMADETRVQVLKEPERNSETDSFMWLFRTGEDGLPPDRGNHGLGLRSIRAVAEKYGGLFRCRWDAGRFYTQAVLFPPLPADDPSRREGRGIWITAALVSAAICCLFLNGSPGLLDTLEELPVLGPGVRVLDLRTYGMGQESAQRQDHRIPSGGGAAFPFQPPPALALPPVQPSPPFPMLPMRTWLRAKAPPTISTRQAASAAYCRQAGGTVQRRRVNLWSPAAST